MNKIDTLMVNTEFKVAFLLTKHVVSVHTERPLRFLTTFMGHPRSSYPTHLWTEFRRERQPDPPGTHISEGSLSHAPQ